MAKDKTSADKAGVRTRREIQRLLKLEGPLAAQALADALGVTAMAARQHLYDMEKSGLVTFSAPAGGRGRPTKLWRLTPAADRYFPDAHADLAVDMIAAMKTAFGDSGLDAMLAVRSEQQIAAYRREVDATAPIAERVGALAAIRTREGYMAQVADAPDGAVLLIENHCPICAAARACSGLCRQELAVFQAVLGDDVSVERTDHILAGARRCAYRITAAARLAG